jgi:vacuolar protein sorting-associated protein 54
MFLVLLWVSWLISPRLVADAQHFQSRMSKLDGAGDLGDYILDLVKKKDVVSESSSKEVSTAETNGGNGGSG